MLLANYHTHTSLCGHAIGKVNDYVEEAIKLGLKELGMSDHAHTPKSFMSAFDYERNGLSQIMSDDDFENIYKSEVLKAKDNPKIKVFLGLETEYFPEYHNYFVDLRRKLDYLILGLHFFNYKDKTYSTYEDINEETLEIYTDIAIQAMASGLYSIFAHPDLFMYAYQSKEGYRIFDDACKFFSKKIIDAAIKYDVYLEVNANGIHNTYSFFPEYKNFLYPREEFWKLAGDTDAKIIIGADAHSPKALGNNIVKEAITFTKKLNLNVCDFVKLKPQN